MLLEELRPFDNQVYGVAYGLLMGQNESNWSQALSLFDDMKRMDSSTASGFYNALTDMLWHFGQVTYFFREKCMMLRAPAYSANIIYFNCPKICINFLNS